MTDHTDLIARLREGQKYDCESGYPIVMDYIMDEAADALQAAQAEIERLQTTVKHLSDAAANATFAEKAALARLATLGAVSAVTEEELFDAAVSWCESNGINSLEPDQLSSLVNSLCITMKDAATGASPVQPSQAGELSDEEIEAVAKPFIRSVGGYWENEPAIPDDGNVEEFARAIIAAINAKESK